MSLARALEMVGLDGNADTGPGEIQQRLLDLAAGQPVDRDAHRDAGLGESVDDEGLGAAMRREAGCPRAAELRFRRVLGVGGESQAGSGSEKRQRERPPCPWSGPDHLVIISMGVRRPNLSRSSEPIPARTC